MNKKRHNISCSWKFWLFILSILICIGICISPSIAQRVDGIINSLAQRADGIIKLSSTSSQDPNQHNSEPSSDAGTASDSTPAVIPQSADPSVHAVTQAAVKLGILSCLKRINQVSTFLTANAKSGVLILPSKDQPDQHIFSTSFEILPPDNSIIYASASFFPNNDAVYDTVQYVDKTCEELEKNVFKHLKRKSVLKENIILLDSGAVKVFLMPAGSGCVVIKKEVVQ